MSSPALVAPNPLLEAALAYAALGWRVVPLHNLSVPWPDGSSRCTCQDEWRDAAGAPACRTPGKHPRFKEYSRIATTDEAKIRAWWRAYPDANVGLIAGKGSGFFVFDTDPRNNGHESRERLVYKYGQLPYTTTAQTGGFVEAASAAVNGTSAADEALLFGSHEYFTWPADVEVPNCIAIEEGIELIGEGHVVVAAPSLHPSGKRYRWAEELGPDEMMPQPPPAWLVELIRGRVTQAPAAAPNAERGKYPPADINPIMGGCGWLQHCSNDARSLSEPEWYAMLAIVGRCENGEALAHELSSPHPGYTRADTAAKLRHALQGAGPTTCAKVRGSLGCGHWCEQCPSWGRIKSPIVLGTGDGRRFDTPSMPPAPGRVDDALAPPPAERGGGMEPESAGGGDTKGGGGPGLVASIDPLERAVMAAIESKNAAAVMGLAAQFAGAPELRQAELKAIIREAFGRKISMRDLERAIREAARSLAAVERERSPRSAWRDHLRFGNGGSPERNLANAIAALRHCPDWKDVLWRDEFGEYTVVRRKPPIPVEASGRWTNIHDILTCEWLQLQGIDVTPSITTQAVEAVAWDRKFHPVKEYLNGLKWDGTPRLKTWLQVYLGVVVDGSKNGNETFLEATGSKWLISAVARVFQPGCKADCMLIMEGEQGMKKSSALKELGGEWFTDEIAEIGSKDSSMQTHGIWIIEVGELESMSKSEVGAVKAFLSRTVDRYRPPYSARLVESPRQCVFAGTVNGGSYLRDETGGRRFWPVSCGLIDLAAIRRDRDRLWAEALVQYKAGASWWLEGRELVADAEHEQLERYRPDPWEPKVRAALLYADEITVDKLLGECLNIPTGKWTQTDANRVAAILQVGGWRKLRGRKGEQRLNIYRPYTREAVKNSGKSDPTDVD